MIQVVLSRPKKFDSISWFIRKVTAFDASHATVHIHGTGLLSRKRLVLEASGQRGVSLVPAIRWDKINQAVYAFTLKDEGPGKRALATVWDSLGGADYDYKGLWHFGFRLVLQRLGITLKAPNTPTKLFCSELVSHWLIETLKNADQQPLPWRPDEIAPKHLYQALGTSELFNAS